MSQLQKKLFNSKGLPPRPVGPYPRLQAKKKDYSTTSWTEYFDSEHNTKVTDSKNVFHMYKRGDSGPIIVFLHGGGFSGLSWALLSKSLSKLVHCQCVAVDQRGHGQSSTDDDSNLTPDQLASDVCEIVNFLINESSETSPAVILVGHSMGGAIAIHAASKNKVPNLVGLVVIDVVEGSALESLHAMHGVLKNRPRSFESVEKATEWCVRTGYVRNLESAKVSMIGQLKKLDQPIQVSTRHYSDSAIESMRLSVEPITEEDERPDSNCCGSVKVASKTPKDDTAQHSSPETKTHHYTWKIDLSKTSQYWEGWFKGMSSMFLSVDVPKMLMLAGIDRLDTQLTAAQMQGKFQMQVLSKSGHAVHEDVPDKVAEAIAAFLVRHKFAEAACDFKRPFPAC